MNAYKIKVYVVAESTFDETVIAENIIPAIEKVWKKYEEKYGDKVIEIQSAKLLGRDVIS